ncbi:MAG TPA: hypothetical protein PLI56_00260 [Exilispira sp.]|nr:hypothetical protein [Exilispira sp.]
MKKFMLVVLLLLLISTPVLAQESNDISQFFQSYLDNGDLSFYASAGYWWGFCINAGVEYTLGEWNIANIWPIDYGVAVKVLYEGWSYAGYGFESYIGAAPFFMLHIGVKGTNLDFYEGIGLGFAFYMGNYYSEYNDFEIGFAAVSGVSWYFSKNMGLILEYAYIGWVSTWGIGITMKL